MAIKKGDISSGYFMQVRWVFATICKDSKNNDIIHLRSAKMKYLLLDCTCGV